MKVRTSQQIQEDVARTLYVRLPHTIKDSNEIKELFVGDIIVKMPRQSSRHCHVVFSSIEEKMKNLKNVKKMKIDGKKILACPPKLHESEEKRKKEKKIRIPKPKPEQKITRTLHICNIKPGTKARDIKTAFPGCVSVILLKSKGGKTGRALLKLGSIQLAGEYVRKERAWPEVNGNILAIKTDTRKRKKTSGKNKSTGLKIYDGEEEENVEKKSNSSDKSKESTKAGKNESEDSQESEEEDEEQEESDEVDESEVEEE